MGSDSLWSVQLDVLLSSQELIIFDRLTTIDLRSREGCEELSPVHRLDKATTGV